MLSLSGFCFPCLHSALAAAGVLLSFGGCCYRRGGALPAAPVPAAYSRVLASDFEGRAIAEYIAEGPVFETELGFRFRAVERRIFRPRPLVFRYPLGRPVTVAASNLLATPACKPAWLIALEAQGMAECEPPTSFVDSTIYR